MCVCATARPILDAKAWDNVFEQLARDFAAGNRRAFDIDLGSQFGQDIQNLFGVKAVKVQAAPSPMQRRFLMDQAYSARGVALEYIDSTRHIEVEQLEEIRRPKSRFSQAVRRAVFVPCPMLPKEPSFVSVPGLPTDFAFPTLGPQVITC